MKSEDGAAYQRYISIAQREDKGITFIYSSEKEEYVSYRQLSVLAHRQLAVMQSFGIEPGQKVILCIRNNKDFLISFHACLIGGFVPVPLSQSENETAVLKLSQVYAQLNQPFLVTDQKDLTIDGNNVAKIPADGYLTQISPDQPADLKSDIAFIQYSSGSTGSPKGIVLTHHNLTSNIRAMLLASKTAETDKYLSWMPLTHDMGLIGFHLTPMQKGVDQIIMDTKLFVRKPLLWLQKASEFQATILCSPNFGYEYVLKNWKSMNCPEIDLTKVRIIYNGAEPISTSLANKFLSTFSVCGLKQSSMLTVYGLAEASLAVTYPPIDEVFLTHSFDRNKLSVGDFVVESNDEHSIRFADVGFPVADCEVVICDKLGHLLPENTVGIIHIKGENVTAGYLGKNAEFDFPGHEGWLNTGDIGLIKNGRLIITGRAKDIIFVNGQNFYPHDIENCIESLLEIQTSGKVAVAGFSDPLSKKETLLIFISNKNKTDDFIDTILSVKRHITRIFGIEKIIVIPVKSIQKTTSGKIQRFFHLRRFEEGYYHDIIAEVKNAVNNFRKEHTNDVSTFTETESKLLAIWHEVLATKEISRDCNLLDLGGSSIQVVQIISRIKMCWNVHLTFQELFENLTIRKLSVLVDQLQKSASPVVGEITSEFATQEYYPLSNSQKQFWLTNELQDSGEAYHLSVVNRLSGSFNKGAFFAAFVNLFKHYEILRTAFILVDGEPAQKILTLDQLNFSIEEKNFNDKPESENLAIEWIQEQIKKPFDLTKPPLLRVVLANLNEQTHLLGFVIHHIITDGWSLDLMFREIQVFYNAFNNITIADFPSLTMQYRSYSSWQKQSVHQNTNLHKQYWLEKLSGELPVLELNTDRKRPAIQTFNGAKLDFQLPSDTCLLMENWGKARGVTLFMTLLAALKTLLFRYSGQTDILIGSTAAGRNHPAWEDQLGCFLNTLLLRTELDPSDSFEKTVEKVKFTTLGAFENQEYPAGQLVEDLGFRRDPGRSGIFDVMMILQNSELQLHGLTGLDHIESHLVPIPQRTSKFDLTFDFVKCRDHINLAIEYNTDLYDETGIVRLVRNFENLIHAAVTHSEIEISRLDYIDNEQKNRLLKEFSSTEIVFLPYKSIADLLELQASKTPQKTALQCENSLTSYQELHERSNQIAHFLKEYYQTQPEDRIAIITERSPEMLAGMFGIIKSEAAYVPIDPAYPIERIKFILADSQCKAVLIDTAHYKSLSGTLCCPCILLNVETFAASSTDNLVRTLSPQNLAYIIFTSGSTGKPKGVMVEHKSLLNFTLAATQHYEISESDRVLQFASISFDAGIEEIFPCLTTGATLVLRTQEMLHSTSSFIEKCAEWDITVLDLPTAFWTQLTEEIVKDQLLLPENLRLIIIGGEAANIETLSKWQNQDIIITNSYGPTEATVVATFHPYAQNVSAANSQNAIIGKPIFNVHIYITDVYGQLVPIGVPGEICIAGPGVARGYCNLPELTGKVFIDNPFGNGKLYKTGDIGKWLPDGNIAFLGRKDDQVKIRGFRIEPSEIEQVLMQHPDVRRAIVMTTLDQQNQVDLVAYIETFNNHEPSEWRSFLKKHIPDYMIPAFYIQLDKFPVNVQGKIDKKAMRLLSRHVKETKQIIQPETLGERQLLEIWRQVFKNQNIGVTDNFFEIGGHSLKAMQILAKVQKQLGWAMDLRMLFANPTIREIVQLVTGEIRYIETEIPVLDAEEHYPISNAQKRLWILDQLEENPFAYHISGTYSVDGDLDIALFAEAFQYLIRRHEILRTRFVVIDGNPRQMMESSHSGLFRLETEDLSNYQNFQARVLDYAREQFIKPYDLTKCPLIRGKLLKISQTRFLFLFSMHHIISDGWSMEIILREISMVYNYLKRGEKISLEPLRIQYRDYASWQRNQLETGMLENQRQYWLNQLAGDIPTLQLPTDYARPPIKTYRGDLINFTIDASRTAKIRVLARQENVTLFTFLLSIVKILFYRYTNQTDMIIGSPVAGREHSELNDQIGFYVNTLALRTQFEPDETFQTMLGRVKETVIDAYLNQSYPFDELVEQLAIPRDISRSALFDVMVVLQETSLVGGKSEQIEGVAITKLPESLVANKFDIIFYFTEDGDSIKVGIEYSCDLFKKERMERMSAHFVTLTDDILANPQSNLYAFNYLPTEESNLLLDGFNPKRFPFPAEKTLMQIWEESVEKYPEKIALRYGNNSLTYNEFYQKSNQLANFLKSQYGIGRGQTVAILLERSEYLMIAIFGTLKAGAAYVPIDPKLPAKRIAHIVSDSGAKLLLTSQSHRSTVRFLTIPKLNCDDQHAVFQKSSDTNPAIENVPADPLYIMYTSGSTGNPKGVVVSNVGVNNLLTGLQKAYPVQERDCFLFKTSFSFDVSVTEIFGWFFGAGSLVILEKDEEKDPGSILKCIDEQKVTHINFSPSMLGAFLENVHSENRHKLASLKYVFAAGEALSAHIVNTFYQKLSCKLENLYGPTEATVYATGGPVNADRQVTIGKPLQNTRIYILDDYNALTGIGIPGQLCIAGPGLATGYHGNPELTAEKFIPNPFSPESRVYKTGDMARWLSDGTIEYLGRADNQVKVRGYRVELAEIEAALLDHPAVKEAIVVVSQDCDGSNELIGYVAIRQNERLKDVRQFLKERLPEYMIPAHFVQLEDFPVNTNGKVDRRKLLDFSLIETQESPDNRPMDDTELKLAEIWALVLNRNSISITDNFFEIGGHSLKATQVILRVHKVFDVNIPLKLFFQNPTIESFSKIICAENADEFEKIPALPVQEYYELSQAQKRLWVLSQLDGNATSYNMPAAFSLKGKPDKAALNLAFQKLVERHEILRTVILKISGEPKQKIIAAKDFHFDVREINLESDVLREQVANQLIEDEKTRSFNIETGPLIRATLIELDDEHYFFLFTMHHIIADGWSINNIIKEITIYYNEAIQKLPHSIKPLKIQYKDFAAWQQNQFKNGILEPARRYWLDQLSGDLPVLDLPTDHSRPTIRSENGRLLKFDINPSITKHLEKICEKEDATLFMVLLAALNVLVYRYTGQTDMIIGSPIAGRTHADLEDQIGLYLNTLSFRTKLAGTDRFSELLAHVRETALAAYTHQAYPFDYLVNDLNLQRDLRHSPLFDVMLVVQNYQESDARITLPSIEIKPVERLRTQCQYDLSFEFARENDAIAASIEFNADLFDQSSMKRMVTHFKEILASISNNIDSQLGEINYIPNEEKQEILTEFNNTAKAFSSNTIIQCFEEQVNQNPDKVALLFGSESITYSDLNNKANQLASYLIHGMQLQTEQLIGVITGRSIDNIIALLGIWKAGAAYLPIDPTLPDERISSIIRDASPALILANEQSIHPGKKWKNTFLIATVLLTDILETTNSSGFHNPCIYNSPESLAYSIYTSGSTGVPKGVLVEHRSILNFTQTSVAQYQMTNADRILQFASPGFDAAFEEILPCLISGATLVIRTDEMLGISTFVRQCNAYEITVLDLPTAFWHQLTVEINSGLQLPTSLRLVIIGGEAAAPDTVKTWKKKVGNYPLLVNTYGPTEATVVATSCDLSQFSEDFVPIGKPIANAKVYIVDQDFRPVGIGVKGEIVIGGAGVARGYRNQNTTAEKFVDSPFVENDRLYRTGDLGKWLEDGNIVFAGRLDNQLKIRGYRVEPAEIENVLDQHPMINESIVLARKNASGEDYLTAYVTVQEDLATANVKEFVRRFLPDYMVPDRIVFMDRFPISINGKIDLKQLPEPEEDQKLDISAGPMSKMEVTLLQLWQEVLGKKSIGIGDNFFEIGGHSLKAVQLVSRIYQRFHVAIELSLIFKNPTISQLAIAIQGKEREKYIPIISIPEQDYYDVSSSQKRLWLLSQDEAASVTYNMTGAYVLNEAIDLPALRKAFDSLIERHESLRTVFKIVNGDLKQQVLSFDNQGFKLQEVDLSQHDDQKLITDQLIKDATVIHFDLEKGPLLAATLLKHDAVKFVLIFSAHHIISDGWSVDVLERELAILYQAYSTGKDNPLTPLSIQYRDYTDWQNRLIQSDSLKEHQIYWTEKMKDLPVNDLPTDHIRSISKTYNGKTMHFSINAGLFEQVKSTAKANDATLFMTLLTTSYMLLHHYSGQEDIIMGTPVAGRQHSDLENQVGFYLNTLALRAKVNGQETPKSLLRQTREVVLEAFDHQIYPFDHLLEDILVNQGESRMPVFDVLIALQNTEPDQKHEDFQFEEYGYAATTTSRFDLTFIFTENSSAQSLEACIEYNTDLFIDATIRSLADNFLHIIQILVQEPDLDLSQISWQSDMEEKAETDEFLRLMHTIN